MLEHLFFCCLVRVLNSNLFEFIVLSLSLSLNRNRNRNRKGAQTLELAQTQNNLAHPFPAAQSALSFSCLGPASWPSWFPRTARAAQHSPSPLPHTRPDPARPAPGSAASKARPASPRARHRSRPLSLRANNSAQPRVVRPDPPVPPASVARCPSAADSPTRMSDLSSPFLARGTAR